MEFLKNAIGVGELAFGRDIVDDAEFVADLDQAAEGVLRAGWRPLVIPSEPVADGTAPSICAHDKNKVSAKNDSSCQSAIHPRRYGWAELLKRVFLVDVLICPHCGGCLRILSAIIPLEPIVKILDCLGLPSKPPQISPAEPDRDP